MSNITNNTSALTQSKWMFFACWTVQILLAAAFLAAGGAKLASAPAMVAIFDQVGVGQWFRYVTGAVEITGAILILIPKTVIFGAALLACTMASGVLTHLAMIGGNPLPAVMLLGLNVLVLWLRRDDVRARITH